MDVGECIYPSQCTLDVDPTYIFFVQIYYRVVFCFGAGVRQVAPLHLPEIA